MSELIVPTLAQAARHADGARLDGSSRGIGEAGRLAWHLVGIALIAVGLGWLVWRLRIVAFPLFVAVLVAAVLTPIRRALVRRGLGRGLASAVLVVGLLALLSGIGFLVIPAVGDQLGELTTKVGEGLDRLERWVARERPFGLDANDVRRFRSDVEATTPDTATLANGARAAGTVLAGVVFAVIASFFFLRDGRKMVDSAVALLPVGWHEDAWSIAHSIVSSLAYYARGAAVLGAVESIAIGVAVAAVGGDLAVVLALITFLGAFIPFVGAIIAGLVAVGATLVSAGTTPAIIVAVVALVVQQLDNDFLAPVIYGRFLQIHPLAILASISVGIETGGLIGAFVAVPVAASAVSIWRVLAQRRVRQLLTVESRVPQR